jgi:hypothetical protein
MKKKLYFVFDKLIEKELYFLFDKLYFVLDESMRKEYIGEKNNMMKYIGKKCAVKTD